MLKNMLKSKYLTLCLYHTNVKSTGVKLQKFTGNRNILSIAVQMISTHTAAELNIQL